MNPTTDKPVKELTIKLDSRGKIVVERADYVSRKTAQLREFGYPDVSESHVDAQIDALLGGKKFGEGLDTIGMMLEGEVIT